VPSSRLQWPNTMLPSRRAPGGATSTCWYEHDPV
jgi:hypothetical protein